MSRWLLPLTVLAAAAVASAFLLVGPQEQPRPAMNNRTIPEPGTPEFRKMAVEVAADAEDLNGRTIPGGRVLITIYQRPTDYPQGYVARQYIVQARPPKVYRGEVLARAPTLEEAREAVPKGFAQLPNTGEDPSIAEVWFAK